MTPEQQRFIDYATVEAAANGFPFELREPRDEREGAALTIKGQSGGYYKLAISPDGWVGWVETSPSYDRDLAKFIKKLEAAGKKMRPKPEKKPKPPRAPARRCSSGSFKDHAIIRQIVDRVHVGASEEEVLEYARSRLAAGAWDKMAATDRKAFECEVLKVHDRNRATYRQVSAHATVKGQKLLSSQNTRAAEKLVRSAAAENPSRRSHAAMTETSQPRWHFWIRKKGMYGQSWKKNPSWYYHSSFTDKAALDRAIREHKKDKWSVKVTLDREGKTAVKP